MARGRETWWLVQGIGGWGTLGVQFANKSGYKVAAIGRGSENAVLAKKLGAHVYIDSAATKAGRRVEKIGRGDGDHRDGAEREGDVRTDRWARAQRAVDGGGRGLSEPIEVTPVQLIVGVRGDSRMGGRHPCRGRGHSAGSRS